MASSAVHVCSNALLLLGDKPINSFDESYDRALLCSNLWDNARQAVLRAHPWNCAKARVSLAPETETPAFDWAYQFALPGNCLRVLFVGESGVPEDYTIEGRRILADVNPLYLTYIYDNEDVASWDALLIETMQRYMAFSMAYPLTKSATLRDSMYQEYANLLKSAKAVDGQEEPPETVGDSPFIDVRR